MSTFAELNAEIDNFQTVTTPKEGSEYPWRHFPQRIIDGISRAPGIRCGCGRVFEAQSWEAPSDQPAPKLWAAFQRFKEHVAAVQHEHSVELAHQPKDIILADEQSWESCPYCAIRGCEGGCRNEQARILHYELSTGERD